MDAKAVLAASSDDLAQLGLNQRGHVLCLKAEAMKSTELTDVKRKGILATLIKKSTSERVVTKMLHKILKSRLYKLDGNTQLMENISIKFENNAEVV